MHITTQAWADEVGRGQQVYLEFELTGYLDIGEPAVRYRDGSCHPGTPAHVDYESVYVTRMVGEGYDYKRRDRPDWFAWLDSVVDVLILHDLYNYEEWMLEEVIDREDH